MGNYNENHQSAGKSKLLKGILLGALAGGAISMLDRNTRKSALASSRSCAKGMVSFMKNPNEGIEKVKNLSNQIRTTIRDITEEVSFFSEKIDEFRDIPGIAASVDNDTKNVLASEGKHQSVNRH